MQLLGIDIDSRYLNVSSKDNKFFISKIFGNSSIFLKKYFSKFFVSLSISFKRESLKIKLLYKICRKSFFSILFFSFLFSKIKSSVYKSS